jgi:hypothetical protein
MVIKFWGKLSGFQQFQVGQGDRDLSAWSSYQTEFSMSTDYIGKQAHSSRVVDL